MNVLEVKMCCAVAMYLRFRWCWVTLAAF